jgi:hypothetical protein
MLAIFNDSTHIVMVERANYTVISILDSKLYVLNTLDIR